MMRAGAGRWALTLMDDSPPAPPTAEHARLAEATRRAETDLFTANPWYECGPYLSERAWGTVREDYSADGDAGRSFPHDVPWTGCRRTRRGGTNLLFFEYFHGDDRAGLGAMHQTGWTALVVDLILDPPGTSTPGKRDQSTAT